MSNNPAAEKKAIALRKKGLSPKVIGEKLGIPRGTIYHWVRHVELTEAQKAHLGSIHYGKRSPGKASQALQDKCRNVRELYRQEGREAAQKGSQSHSMACALYWAEGKKGRNAVCLANTDPQMILFFYRFLTEWFDGKVKISFTYHEDEGNAPAEEASLFWAGLLGVDSKEIVAYPNRDMRARTGFKKKRHRNGMCILTLCSTRAVQHIYGALETYAEVSFEN